MLEEGLDIVDAFARIVPPEKYLHWDKLQYYTPPIDIKPEYWWLIIKLKRQSGYKNLPNQDTGGKPFVILTDVEPIAQRLHDIDLRAGGHIKMPEQIMNRDTRDQYIVSSLIQEAITSSQLEGAATTRLVAKDMLKSGRKPTDRSEQMILNNFETMQFITGLKDSVLTPRLVFEIHRRVTRDTLDEPSAAGRFRTDQEAVHIADPYGEVLHRPPSSDSLAERLQSLCDFANSDNEKHYIHPVLRSIVLHFWLAYDHPFVDGNGRTARALFYWSMLRNGYWLFEFVSISQVILKAPARYEKAFLYTETDDNDLTYFLLYHLDVIDKAVKMLHEYVDNKTKRLEALEKNLRGLAQLNIRQRLLISHALKHPNHKYTFRSHQRSHNVAYQTSRLDLLNLEELGLLIKSKTGKTWHFTPSEDLESKIDKLV